MSNTCLVHPSSTIYSNNAEEAITTMDKFTQINAMSSEKLVTECEKLQLHSLGDKSILQRRLKNYYRSFLVTDNKKPSQLYQYLLIIDFEATCERDSFNAAYQHEIIEFPIVLFDVINQTVIDEFHSFCRPSFAPKLSTFCIELTKIEQATVDSAPLFLEVLKAAELWMDTHHLFDSGVRFAVVCDCSADMAKFMRIQSNLCNIKVPQWCRYWVNLRKTFRSFYSIHSGPMLSLGEMLSLLGLEFEGQCHSGLHDAKNIARIVEQLVKDGAPIIINEKLTSTPNYFCTPVSSKEADKRCRSPKSQHSKSLIPASPQKNSTSEKQQQREQELLYNETEESLADLVYLMNLKKQQTHVKKSNC